MNDFNEQINNTQQSFKPPSTDRFSFVAFNGITFSMSVGKFHYLYYQRRI